MLRLPPSVITPNAQTAKLEIEQARPRVQLRPPPASRARIFGSATTAAPATPTH
jgi:hypothetical protein